MIRINEVIIVEGKFDSALVRSCVDTLVLETGGFRIFNDTALINTVREFAAKRGVVILTDSDRAGYMIRNKIIGMTDGKNIKNAYIPAIHGTERRKRSPSKDGLLGVEGVDCDTIISALAAAGVEIDGKERIRRNISKADFYEMGLSGSPDSSKRRMELQAALGLPLYLSANKLFEILRYY